MCGTKLKFINFKSEHLVLEILVPKLLFKEYFKTFLTLVSSIL